MTTERFTWRPKDVRDTEGRELPKERAALHREGPRTLQEFMAARAARRSGRDPYPLLEKLRHASHDQSTHGNWADGSSVAARLAKAAEEAGGFTFDSEVGTFVAAEPDREPSQHRGVVAIPGSSARITMEGFRDPVRGKRFIGRYLKDHEQAIQNGAKVGGWHDTENDEMVLDIVEVLPLSDAVEAGRERGEQAIWNLDGFEEISTGGTGGREDMLVEGRNLPEEVPT